MAVTEDKNELSDIPPDGMPSSALDFIPGGVLADLVGQEDPHADIARRDYGDRYDYRDVLGEGGQGIVVRARDLLLERDVAIKALKLPLDPTKEKYLEREAKLCGLLEHPNILPTYDLAYDETGSPLMVMKRLEGRTFEDLLKDIHVDRGQNTSARHRREHEMSRLRLLNIFLQVCHAIEFAHSRKVLHLDIKPSNIKLGSFGEVYVIDWGFAAFFNETPKHIAGTPIYIAPERFERRIPDVRCDVYSLGVMLYRILTNRHPRDVPNMTFREYREKYREIPVIPPRERDRTIPPALEAIVLKAMADEPHERYQKVHELADDLDRFLDLLPVRAYAEGPFSRGWRYLRKHKRMSIATAITLCLLGISGVAIWRSVATEYERRALEAESIRIANEQREKNARRARARRVLARAVDLVEKSRDTVDAASDQQEKERLLQNALRLFEEAVAIDKDFAEAFYERGKAHRLAHHMTQAVEDFNTAFALDNSLILAKYDAGLLYQNNFKQPEKARHAFAEIHSIYPEDEYAMLGQAYVDLEEAYRLQKSADGGATLPRVIELYDRTIALCNKIEAKNTGLGDIWFLRAMVYQRSPNHLNLQNAINAYTEYLYNRSDNPTAFHNRGDAYKDMGDFEKAVADYTQALVVNPQYVNSLKNRGYLLYAKLSQPEKGLADLNTAVEYAPKDFWAYMGRGAIFEGLGRFEEAARDYQTAFTLKPQSPYIFYRLGSFNLRRGRLDLAEENYTKAITLSPEGDQAIKYYRRGIVRLALGKNAEAISDFEASLRLRDSGHVYPALMRYLALKFQGLPVDPTTFGRHLDVPEGSPWLAAVGSYYLHEATEDDVLRMAKDPLVSDGIEETVPYEGDYEQRLLLQAAENPKAICEARFYLGAYALANGDIHQARSHLQAAVDTGIVLYTEHALAKAFLVRIEKMSESQE